MSYCNKTGSSYKPTTMQEGKPYPTKNGYEAFTIRPVVIKNGIVSTKREEAYGS